MPRVLSTNVLDSLTAQETAEAYHALLTVKGHDKTVLARFTTDSVDTVTTSPAATYLPYPFAIRLPDNQEGRETKAELIMTNVDRQLIDSIRGIQEHLFVDIRVVLHSDPDDLMAYYPDMELRNVTYDTMTISGELNYESFIREPFPSDVMSGRFFPGLFKR